MAACAAALLFLVSGCGEDRFASGQEVWIEPGGLGARPGSWIIAAPWAVGRVLETKERMVQVQIERAESAGIGALKEVFRAGNVQWFPEEQLQPVEKGRKAHEKRAVARQLLTRAFRGFSTSGMLRVPLTSIEQALKVAGGEERLALRILRVASDPESPETDRIGAIRELIADDQTARVAAGKVLLDWISRRRFDRLASSVLDFRKNRRALAVQPRLSESVPGAMAGAAAIAAFRKLHDPAGVGQDDAFPTLQQMARWERLERDLAEMAFDAMPELEKTERGRRIEQVVLQWKEERRQRLAQVLKAVLEATIQELSRKKEAGQLESFRETVEKMKKGMTAEKRYWPLTDQELEIVDRRAKQQLALLRKKEAERKAREEKERKIRERDARLLKELTALAGRAVQAIKARDFPAACEIGAAIPGRVSSLQQALVSPNIGNVFVPKFTRVSRYEEYKEPLHGASRLAELEFKSPGGLVNKVQFREIHGRWKIYSVWWDNRGGEYLAKSCEDWLAAKPAPH